jgi:O-antigen/teichoic acid export membrane protein
VSTIVNDHPILSRVAEAERVEDDLPPGEGVASGTVFALVAQVTTTLFTAVLTLYLVRALGPESYGVFGLALGVGTFALLLADLGVSNSAARFVAERRGNRSAAGGIVADALRLKLVLGGAVAVAIIALAQPIASAYQEAELAWALRGMALAIFGQSLMMLYLESFVAMGRISRNVRITLIESLAETTASIALVALGAGAAGATFGRAAGYGVGAAVAALAIVRLLGRRAVRLRRARDEAGRAGRMIRYALPLLVTNSAYALYSTVDVVLVGALLSTTAVGLFSAPMRLCAFLTILGIAAGSSVAPRLARWRDDASGGDALRGALRWLVMGQGVFVAPLLVWAEPIVALLLGSEFRDSAGVLRALTPYAFLIGISPLISTAVNYIGLAGRRIPIVLGSLALNIAVDVALLREIGVIAAAIGTSAAYLVYVPAHFHLLTRTVKVPWRPLMASIGRTLVAAAAMAGVLALAGTSELTVVGWIAGGLGGLAAYVLVLLGTGQLKAHEIKQGVGAARRRLGAAG